MSTDATESKVAPAYVAYPSLTNLIASFKEHGVPGQVDRSVMLNFSGGTQSHLMTTLKFLKLLGPSNIPNENLRKLTDAYGTEQWSQTLNPVVREAYADILGDLNIASATPNQVEQKFRAASVEGSTLDKAMRFFVQVLKEAKIPHSPHLGRRKPSAPRKKKPDEATVGNGTTDETPATPTKKAETPPPPPPPADMISFPIPFHGKTAGTITVPKSITTDDCAILKIMVQAIETYASQNTVSK